MGQREDGSAAVEFALVMPLVLLAALALVQVGLISRDSAVVALAAREGSREAVVNADDGAVRDAALRSGGLAEGRTRIDVRRSGGVGDPVTVVVRYRPPLVVPFVEWLFPGEVELSSDVTMRQETDGLESP